MTSKVVTGIDLLELAASVEAASGPDREIDALIAAAIRVCHKDWGWADQYPAWHGRADGRMYLYSGGPSFEAPAFTGSLDAAVTLVPEGAKWVLDTHYNIAQVSTYWTPSHAEDWGYDNFEGEGSTPALALTAAALRARASLIEGGGE